MKSKLFILLTLTFQISFGQAKQQGIPGTKFTMIPPQNFIASTSFSGFQNANLGASIMVTEIPGSFEKINDGFTAQALQTQGMTLINKEIIDFNNSKAAFVYVSQKAYGKNYLKQILMFGDSKKTILVNGIYPEENKSIEPDIKKSLLSIIYDEFRNDNPLDAVKFSIDVTGTDFKLAKFMSGSLVYSQDGQIPTTKPTLIVGPSIAKVASANQKQYSIDRIKKLPRGELNTIKSIDPIQIDKLQGYEIIANGKSKDSEDQLIYQVMLFDEAGDYFIILGNGTGGLDTNLQRFKKIARSFRRK